MTAMPRDLARKQAATVVPTPKPVINGHTVRPARTGYVVLLVLLAGVAVTFFGFVLSLIQQS